MKRALPVVILVVVACTAQSGDASAPTTLALTTTSVPTTPAAAASRLFPDVVGVEVTTNADGSYRFDVTISSPYDSADQYADAWRVLGPDGTEYAVRILTHPHANEQPFTRSLDGIAIPSDVNEVVVEGRDLLNGWGGQTVIVSLGG